MTDVVPLPAHLVECGCPGAQRGWHKTTCAPAREYDATPLQDHPEYAPGRRFQAISWDYPLRLSCDIRVEVEVDPAIFIQNNQEEYDAFEQHASYADWEKPLNFLSSKVESSLDVHGLCPDLGWKRYESRVDAYFDEMSESPHWTEDSYNDLMARLGAVSSTPTVDPNQGDLFQT
jgi:hypothetical protein